MRIYDEDAFFGSGYSEVLTVDELMNILDDADKKKLNKLVEKYDKIQKEIELNKVTEKQLHVINIICNNLHIDCPDNLNKKIASDFIGRYIEKSKSISNMSNSDNYDDELYSILDESSFY